MAFLTRSDGSDAPVEGLLHLVRERRTTMRIVEPAVAAAGSAVAA
jgi:hypothetical protein